MYSVVWCEGGWDDEREEARSGGRCLRECGTLGEAVATARYWAERVAFWRAHPLLAWLFGWPAWGDGAVVVTSPSHALVAIVYGPQRETVRAA